MGLLRDSAIVGAATFLVGSVLKEISIKQEGEPVGWWPYVGTFMSGALGFYLLGATNVVKVKNAESTGCYECGQDYEEGDVFRNCDLCDVLLCSGCNRPCEGCSNTVCNSHRCSKDCCDGAFCDECHEEEFGAERVIRGCECDVCSTPLWEGTIDVRCDKDCGAVLCLDCGGDAGNIIHSGWSIHDPIETDEEFVCGNCSRLYGAEEGCPKCGDEEDYFLNECCDTPNCINCGDECYVRVNNVGRPINEDHVVNCTEHQCCTEFMGGSRLYGAEARVSDLGEDEDLLPVGTKVRSYDFWPNDSSYIEGVIEKIAPSPRCSPNCMHYHIRTTKTVRQGKEINENAIGEIFMTHPYEDFGWTLKRAKHIQVRDAEEIWCDTCGEDELSGDFHVITSMPVDFDSGSAGESATLCGDCYSKYGAEEGQPCPTCSSCSHKFHLRDTSIHDEEVWVDVECEKCRLQAGGYADLEMDYEPATLEYNRTALNIVECPNCHQGFTLNAENWGGDPKGKLALMLQKVRDKAKKPKKPLKIEKLGAESLSAEWDWQGLDWKYVGGGNKLVYCEGCEDYCIPTWSHSAYKCQKCSQLYGQECMDRRRKDGLWCKICESAQFLTRWPEETFHAEGPTDDELESWSERQDDGSMLVTIDEDGDSHTELTYKDGDLTDLKRFMAEVFEADRKARRRTTLTWARGIEPGFIGEDDFFKQPRPYTVDNYFGSSYKNSNAYHISGLPSGYHIHLWKPRRRADWWEVKMKSPNSELWVESYSKSKSQIMPEVLEWYNGAIAVPTETELTPIQQLMIGQGMISGGIQIHRIDIPATIQRKKNKITGDKVSKTIIPGKIQYYYSGGENDTEPTLFATYDGKKIEFSFSEKFSFESHPASIVNFCRGLIYLDTETAGNLRSVNRYNKDRKQWVASHPAWFQNMCKQRINSVHFTEKHGTYSIEDNEFLRFYGTRSLPETKEVLAGGAKKPMFQVRLPIEDGEEVVDDGWITPRPSTQRKMYDNQNTIYGHETKIGIFNKCVAKYQPQEWDSIREKMLEGTVMNNSEGFNLAGSEPAGHIMCRRFKKK